MNKLNKTSIFRVTFPDIVRKPVPPMLKEKITEYAIRYNLSSSQIFVSHKGSLYRKISDNFYHYYSYEQVLVFYCTCFYYEKLALSPTTLDKTAVYDKAFGRNVSTTTEIESDLINLIFFPDRLPLFETIIAENQYLLSEQPSCYG